MNLIDRIDEIKANSVTPEKFEEVWGRNLEEFMDELMDYAAQCIIDNRSDNNDDNHSAQTETPLQPAAAKAVAAAAEGEIKKMPEARQRPADDEGKYLIGTTGAKGAKKLIIKVEKPDNMEMGDFRRYLSQLTKSLLKSRGKSSVAQKQKQKKKGAKALFRSSNVRMNDFTIRTQRELKRQIAAQIGGGVKAPQTGGHAAEPSPYKVAAQVKKGIGFDVAAVQGVKLKIEQSAAGRPVAIVKVDTTGGRCKRRR